jgi:Putative nucleotidyltransferase DUF294/SEFIR domain
MFKAMTSYDQSPSTQDLLLIQLRLERLQMIIMEALDSYTFIGKYVQNQLVETHEEFQKQLKAFLDQLQKKAKVMEEMIQKKSNIFLSKTLSLAWCECESMAASGIKRLQIDYSLTITDLPPSHQMHLQIVLSNLQEIFTSTAELTDLELRVAIQRSLLEAALSRLGQTGTTSPSCFICYSRGIQANVQRVHQLAIYLKQAGVDVRLDIWDQTRTSIPVFISQIQRVDYVLIIGTPDLAKTWLNHTNINEAQKLEHQDAVAMQELEHIETRKIQRSTQPGILCLLLEGEWETSFPDFLLPLVSANLDSRYWYNLQLPLLYLLDIFGRPVAIEQNALLQKYQRIEQAKREELYALYLQCQREESAEKSISESILNDLDLSRNLQTLSTTTFKPNKPKDNLKKSREKSLQFKNYPAAQGKLVLTSKPTLDLYAPRLDQIKVEIEKKRDSQSALLVLLKDKVLPEVQKWPKTNQIQFLEYGLQELLVYSLKYYPLNWVQAIEQVLTLLLEKQELHFQVQFYYRLGADYAKGYYYAAAMTVYAHSFTILLSSTNSVSSHSNRDPTKLLIQLQQDLCQQPTRKLMESIQNQLQNLVQTVDTLLSEEQEILLQIAGQWVTMYSTYIESEALETFYHTLIERVLFNVSLLAQIHFYHQAGNCYRIRQTSQLALPYTTRALHLVEKGLLEEKNPTVQMALHAQKAALHYCLNENLILRWYEEALSLINLLPLDQEILSKQKPNAQTIREWLKQLEPLLDALGAIEQWSCVNHVYQMIYPLLERYRTVYCQGNLNRAKEEDLATFEQEIDGTLLPVIKQLEQHRQWDAVNQYYKLILDHRERQASQFNAASIYAQLVTLNNYRQAILCPPPLQVLDESSIIWHDMRKRLHNLRQAFAQDLDKYQPIEQIQQTFSEGVQTILAKLAETAQGWLGQPPCGFSLLGMGSISRFELAPYSDVDIALLIDADEERLKSLREHRYWQAFIVLFQCLLESLGDPWLLDSSNNISKKQGIGLHVDTGDLHHLFEKGQPLLSNPEALAMWVATTVQQENDDSNLILAYGLLSPITLYNHDGKHLLWAYQDALAQYWSQSTTRPLAQTYIRLHQKDSKTLAHQTCHLKKAYLAPLTYFVGDVVLYTNLWNLNGQTVWNTLAFCRLLEKHQVLDLAFLEALQCAWATVQQLRCRLQIKYARQSDEISFPSQTISTSENFTSLKRSFKPVLTEEQSQSLAQIKEKILQPLFTSYSVWLAKTPAVFLFNPRAYIQPVEIPQREILNSRPSNLSSDAYFLKSPVFKKQETSMTKKEVTRFCRK